MSYAVLAGSRLVVIGADADIRAGWQSDREQKTVGEPWRLAARATAKVWVLQDDQLYDGVQFPVLEPFPLIDQFPDGRWLVVNARSNGQGNARILAADGTETRRIELGDGIEHVKIDDQGRIWVGWFDEGVIGNGKWRLPGHKWPPSAYGMAAFDDLGALLVHADQTSVTDCYALNVFGDEAWACTYTDFPIWRMRPDTQCTWQTSLRGTRAIAVRYPNVLAAGGYQEEASRVVLLKLEEQGVRSQGEWRLPFGVGYPAEVELIDGREDELHLVLDQRWHRWRIADFLGMLR